MCARVKWYGTARWQRRAKLQLTLEPLCAICARKGMVVPAEVADHIVPHKGNESEFWLGPLQSLCKPCHNGLKQQEEHRGFTCEIGTNGLPVDLRHPFYTRSGARGA